MADQPAPNPLDASFERAAAAMIARAEGRLDHDPLDDAPLNLPIDEAPIETLRRLVDEGYAVTFRRNGLGMATVELERDRVRIGVHGADLPGALAMAAAFVR